MFYKLISRALAMTIADKAFRQAYLVLAILTLLMGVLVFYIFYNFFITKFYNIMIVEIISLTFALLAWYLMLVKKSVQAASTIVVVTIFALTLFFIYDQNHHDYAFAQALILPVVAIYLKGLRVGLLYTVVYIGAILIFAFTGIDVWEGTTFGITGFTNLTLTYIIIVLLIFYYEFSRVEAFEIIKKSNNELDAYKNHLEKLVQKTLDEKRQQEYLLVQQSKMAAMGEMMAAITHQWRQPLSTAGMIVENIKLHEKFDEHDPAVIESGLDDIMMQLKFMNDTMKDFTDYFQPREKHTAFALTQTVDAAFKILGVQLSVNHIAYETKGLMQTIELEGYRNEFLQVLLNIINNAKDAIISRIAQGAMASDAGKITLEASIHGKQVHICISDNGGGIQKEALSHLFDAYYTTKHHEGTGIGLYMCKTIIEDHMQGNLTVENLKDGARFCITLNLGASSK